MYMIQGACFVKRVHGLCIRVKDAGYSILSVLCGNCGRVLGVEGFRG